MTHLSLFSGIGGLDIAAEQAGFKTVAFVEREPFCQKVLRKHWPDTPIYDDVTTFDGRRFRGVTAVSAGSPCQGFSAAGLRLGISDPRSALIEHTLRITDECRPRALIIENTPGIIRMAGEWLADRLEAIGYAVIEAVTLPAYPFGAWFSGERTFLISAPYDWCAALRRDGALQPDEAATGSGGYRRDGAKELDSGQRRPLESRPYGVADDVPRRVDSLKALGNAVCPAQAAPLFQAIAQAMRGESGP